MSRELAVARFARLLGPPTAGEVEYVVNLEEMARLQGIDNRLREALLERACGEEV